jgi:hypothetical protein
MSKIKRLLLIALIVMPLFAGDGITVRRAWYWNLKTQGGGGTTYTEGYYHFLNFLDADSNIVFRKALYYDEDTPAWVIYYQFQNDTGGYVSYDSLRYEL